ncbi:MAG: vWA domain-containing protein, partial [Acidobacteriota bacterium]
MTLERWWGLLLIVVPAGWWYLEWTRHRQRLATTLKALALICLLIALAEPTVNSEESKVAVSVLVDTSASVSEQDLARASAVASRIVNDKGRNWVKVIPFGRTTRPLAEAEEKGKLGYTAGPAGRGTDLETALREGMAAMPAGLVPRLALLSDGNENKGSVTRALWQAQQLGIPVDVYPMAGRPKPDLRRDAVSCPAPAVAGDRFPNEITLEAPRAATP